MKNKPVERKKNYQLFAGRLLFSAVIFASLLLSACQTDRPPVSGDIPTNPNAQLPTGAISTGEHEDGQWLVAAKNYASTRFSGLDQINASNVGNLKVAWTFSTGVNRGQEAAPLVVGDTMYVVTPYPNILYALDLKKPGATKWKYEPKPDASA